MSEITINPEWKKHVIYTFTRIVEKIEFTAVIVKIPDTLQHLSNSELHDRYDPAKLDLMDEIQLNAKLTITRDLQDPAVALSGWHIGYLPAGLTDHPTS